MPRPAASSILILSITPSHLTQWNGFNFTGVSGRAKGFIAQLTERLHRVPGGLVDLACVQIRRIFGLAYIAANSAGRSHAQVGIDIDFTDAVFNPFDNFSTGTP